MILGSIFIFCTETAPVAYICMVSDELARYFVVRLIDRALGSRGGEGLRETFSALLAICAENSQVTGEFSAKRPVTRSFGVFFDLRLNERLSKQSWWWWFETPSRHYDVIAMKCRISSRCNLAWLAIYEYNHLNRKCQDNLYVKWE